jgi:uroporphyrinogen-III synthase
MRILITRPEEDAAEFAKALAEAGHEPVICPLLDIVFPPAPPLSFDGVAGLIATSRNGLRGLAHNLALHPIDGERGTALWRTPIFCVGDATARLAREMGFSLIYNGAGGARDLLPLIEAKAAPNDGELLHLGGERLAFDLPGALTPRGYRTRLEALYHTEAATFLPQAVVEALGQGTIGGVVLMSPRTAQIFMDLLWRHGLVGSHSSLVCYCLSQTVAQAFGSSREFVVRVAQKPNVRDMLALVGPEMAR